MTTPLLVGLGVAGGALALKFGMENAKQLGRLNWRGMIPKKTNYPGGFKSPMDRKEAALILGVGTRASKKEIQEVHRNLMRANHPDLGGSPYLSAKINEAKDHLTGARD